MAVQRVEELLRKVTGALGGAGIPYAVVGGNAVAAWVATVDEGAVRATKDVDILVRREDLGDIRQALAPLDMMLAEVLGVTMFVDRQRPNPKTGLHLLFANELIRPHDVHPMPDVTEAVRAAGGFVIIDLPALLRMKLLSFRRVDQVHIEDLLAIDLIDEELVNSLPPDLRERLRQIQETQ